MSNDIVLPRNNEKDFIEIASKLGIKKLYFLYNLEEFNEKRTQQAIDSIGNKKISIGMGLIINNKNLNKIPGTAKFPAAKSSGDDRMLMESKKIKLIYGLEENGKKDRMHQRSSGLNHIMCGIATKNNIYVGFSYGSIIRNKMQSSTIIGKMSQNIKLCKKYKVNTIIASFAENPFELRSQHDVASLFRIMGMDEKSAKESFSYRL